VRIAPDNGGSVATGVAGRTGTLRRVVGLARVAGVARVAKFVRVAAAISIVSISTFVVIGNRLPASAQAQGVSPEAPPPLQTPQLLSDASFDRGLGNWSVSPGQNRAIYTGAGAVGSYYLETNSGSSASPTLYQDVSTPVEPGHSYYASVQLRSSAASPISGSLVIWALGGSAAELGQTQFTVRSSSWATYYTTVDVANPGHALLRLQLYLNTAAENLDVTGTSLQDAGVSHASFAAGLGPWATAPGQNRAIYSSPSAPDGQNYLETNSGSSSSPSVYQDVPNTLLAGHSFTASVFLRSPTGAPVNVGLVLWALGGSTHVGQTTVTVSGTAWARYSTEVDVPDSSDSDLRLQLYLGTAGANLDLAGAALADAGLYDASFESGAGGWQRSTGENFAIYSGGAGEDQHYAETNTGTAGSGGSVFQDIPGAVQAGHTYAATMLLRSPTGAPVTLNVDLWALGSSNQVAQTQVTVSGSAWTRYMTELDVANGGDGDLRLQVYVVTAGVNVDLDAATVAAQPVDPTLTSLRSAIASVAESQDQHQAAVVENPIGSNCNPYTFYFGRGSAVGDYNETCARGTSSEEWCSDFSQWVWTVAGEDPSSVTGWAFSWVSWGQANGLFKPGATNDPVPGDAVVWGDMSSGYGQHVGIVVGVYDGMIDVVSGNSGPADAQGDVYSVWESGYFNPATSTIGPYPIVGYIAPDAFTGS
jgi:Carbohydrate binding domain